MTSRLLLVGGGAWRVIGSGLCFMVQGGVVGSGWVWGVSWVVKKVVVAWRIPAGSVLGGCSGCMGWVTSWRGGVSVVLWEW